MGRNMSWLALLSLVLFWSLPLNASDNIPAAAAPAAAVPVASAFTPPPDTPVIPWLRFSIQYAVRILGSDGPSSIVFFVTTDGGQSWQLLGEDPDKQSPMMVTVPGEGTYGFATVVVSGGRKAAAPRPGTRPDKFVIVDRTPPTAAWISPVNNNVKATADGILLEWTAQDPHLGANPVDIEYSADGGALWLPVRLGLPAKGSINWQVPPAAGENLILRLRAKDLAGNTRMVRNHAKIAVDRTPPTVRITAPDSAGQREFDVYYEASDESGIASVELYYTNDHGSSWAYYNSAASSPIRFANSISGDAVGFYLTATDQKGNRTAAPRPGTPPMKVVALDVEKPQVRLLAPFNTMSTVIESKKPVAISWNTVESNPRNDGTVIEYSTDGGQTWYFIADKQPSSGTYNWTPETVEANALLRVTVTDKYDNKGAALSQNFSIDGGRPNTRITGVKPVGGQSSEVVPPMPTASELTGGDLTVPDIPAVPADVMGSGDEKIGAIDDRALDALPTPGAKTPAAEIAKTPAAPAPAVAPLIPLPDETPIGKEETAAPAGNAPLEIPMPDEKNAPATPAAPAPAAPAKEKEKDPFGDIGSIPSIGSGDLGQVAAPGSSAKSPNDVLEAIPALDMKTIDAAADSKAPADNGLKLPSIPSPAENTGLKLPEARPAAAPKAALDVKAALAKAEAAVNLPDGKGMTEADKLAQEIITQDPNNAAPYNVLAQVRTHQGKLSEAVNFANNACRLAPGNFNYLQTLGYAEYAHANSLYAALRTGQVPASKQQSVSADMVKALNASETAYIQLLKAPEKDQVKAAYFRLGMIDYFRGTKVLDDPAQTAASMRKAIANYQKARDINEPDYREVLQIGICNFRLRDYEQAEIWLERAVEVAANGKTSPKEAYYYLASIHERMDRAQQALEYWEKVAKSYPEGNQFQKTAVEHIATLKGAAK